MQRQYLGCILITVVVTSSCCTNQLYKVVSKIPIQRRIIQVTSYDPYNDLTRAIYSELCLNGFSLVDNTKKNNMSIPLLNIINSKKKWVAVSVAHDRAIQPYQEILSVQASITMPKKNCYPVNIRVHRSFFIDLSTPLISDMRTELVDRQLNLQAAQQLIHKLLIISLNNSL